MQINTEKVRVGFYIEKGLLQQCDVYIEPSNCRSRNDFVNKAIRWYVGHLAGETAKEILPLSITSAVSGAVQLSENRVSRLLFKLAVEMSMMMNVVAAGADLDDIGLKRLRGKCVEDVKRSIGAINFDEVLRFQRGE